MIPRNSVITECIAVATHAVTISNLYINAREKHIAILSPMSRWYRNASKTL